MGARVLYYPVKNKSGGINLGEVFQRKYQMMKPNQLVASLTKKDFFNCIRKKLSTSLMTGRRSLEEKGRKDRLPV